MRPYSTSAATLLVGLISIQPATGQAGDITRGEDLFMNETWGGNGRSCATCHAPEAFFTLNPRYIAALAPTDPLFVHRTDPHLADLEFDEGLVSAAVTNTADSGLLPRGVPSLLGIADQLYEVADNGQNWVVRLGWTGEAAESLIEFSEQAIRQHLTQNLDRIAGVDFRLPSPQEARDLEAYMLSLGSYLENVPNIMRDGKWSSRTVRDGASRYDSLSCYRCHGVDLSGNAIPFAWPIPSFGSMNFNTGTTAGGFSRWRSMASGLGTFIPADPGGAGTFDPAPQAEAFNVPGLLTVFATEPHFHNHLATNLSEAVAYYMTGTFSTSPVGLGMDPTPISPVSFDVDAVTTFLTVAGVVFVGIDGSILLLERPNELLHQRRGVTVWDVARAWILRSAEMLEERAVNLDSAQLLRKALAQIKGDETTEAIALLEQARALIRTPPSQSLEPAGGG